VVDGRIDKAENRSESKKENDSKIKRINESKDSKVGTISHLKKRISKIPTLVQQGDKEESWKKFVTECGNEKPWGFVYK